VKSASASWGAWHRRNENELPEVDTDGDEEEKRRPGSNGKLELKSEEKGELPIVSRLCCNINLSECVRERERNSSGQPPGIDRSVAERM